MPEAQSLCRRTGNVLFVLFAGLLVACSPSESTDPPSTSAVAAQHATELEAAVDALSAMSSDGTRLTVPIEKAAVSGNKLRVIIRSTDGLLAYQVDSLEDCTSIAMIFTEESPYFLPPAVAAIIGELGAQCEALAAGGIGHVITNEERASSTSVLVAVDALYKWWNA